MQSLRLGLLDSFLEFLFASSKNLTRFHSNLDLMLCWKKWKPLWLIFWKKDEDILNIQEVHINFLFNIRLNQLHTWGEYKKNRDRFWPI